jgi:hypothetical protein
LRRLFLIVPLVVTSFSLFAETRIVIEAPVYWGNGSVIGQSAASVAAMQVANANADPSWFARCKPVVFLNCAESPTSAIAADCYFSVPGTCSGSDPDIRLLIVGATCPHGTEVTDKNRCGYEESTDNLKKRKNLGNAGDGGGPPCCGNPINTGTQNKFQREVDFQAPYPGGLSFVRFYNSESLGTDGGAGLGWTHNWGR